MKARKSDKELQAVLIRDKGEVEYYSDLLTRHHYLGSSAVNRSTIVHVVRRGRQDVAVITWEKGPRRWFGMRDKLIGWTKEQKEQRLKYCIENRRFLVLENGDNHATQALSLSLERLGADAQDIYGHEELLAETFVDCSRGLLGSCYKAANWTKVGLTQGGRGSSERSRKLYFIKELKRDALAKLKSVELTPSDTHNPRQQVLSLETLGLPSLRAKLDSISDYRTRNSRFYPLGGVLALLVAAVLCGETRISDIARWVQELSPEVLRNIGVRRCPNYLVLYRALRYVDHNAFFECLCSWLNERCREIHIAPQIKALALDGKALRAAAKGNGSEVHLLTLVDSIATVVKAQGLVKAKSNEIPAAQIMLANVELDAQTIVTADAMHTQDKTAEVIIKKTPITSSLSKTTGHVCAKPLLPTRPKNNGLYRSALKILNTVE